MASWLRGTTLFQRLALLFLAVAISLGAYSAATGQDRHNGVTFFAALLGLIAFRKPLLWRVRNRLIITYLLSTVLPLVLLFQLLRISAILVLGQYALDLVRRDVDGKIANIAAITRELAAAAPNGNANPLEEIRRREPRLAAVVHSDGHTLLSAPEGSIFQAAPAWLTPGFRGLFQEGGKIWFGAVTKEKNGDAFAWLPLDETTLGTITPGVAVVATPVSGGDDDPDVMINPSGATIFQKRDGVRKPMVSLPIPPARHFWDVPLASLLHWDAKTATGSEEIILPVLTRPTQLTAGVVTDRMSSIGVVVFVLGGFFIFVEIASLASTIGLTRVITRSIHDLYQGTVHMAAGDFEHQIPVRGNHQLSELAASFNTMTSQIRHYIGEMRKKDKLESELEIARQVQARLFPRMVPEIPGVELTGVCLPGRVVSGDYYDFVRLDARYTAIALGDVSGKGVSAALLMASIQSSLHAQLKFGGSALNPSLSTATLMGLISQQLYESTPPEKYATFFCSVYDNETGVLRYTNCGHLKPILIRGGQASALDGDGMVVGLLPNVSYEQQEFQLERGDLLAIFSDGIPEAENAREQEFGEDRLGQLLAGHAAEPIESIVSTVLEAVKSWAWDPEGRDDTTLVLMRRT